MIHEAYTIYYLVLYKRILLALVLEAHIRAKFIIQIVPLGMYTTKNRNHFTSFI